MGGGVEVGMGWAGWAAVREEGGGRMGGDEHSFLGPGGREGGPVFLLLGGGGFFVSFLFFFWCWEMGSLELLNGLPFGISVTLCVRDMFGLSKFSSSFSI